VGELARLLLETGTAEVSDGVCGYVCVCESESESVAGRGRKRKRKMPDSEHSFLVSLSG